MKYEIKLPLFSGFYNTIFEFDGDESLCDTMEAKWENLEIDYDRYKEDVAKYMCKFVADNCDLIKSVEFISVDSPREYNFRNDYIIASVDIHKGKLKKFVKEAYDSLEDAFECNFLSRDGFISFYDWRIEDLKKQTKGFSDFSEHEPVLTVILNTYFEFDEITEYQAYEFSEIYSEQYATVKVVEFESLDKFDKIEAIESIWDKVEPELFGYILIEINNAKEKAKLFFTKWIEEIEECYLDEMWNATKDYYGLSINPYDNSVVEP